MLLSDITGLARPHTISCYLNIGLPGRMVSGQISGYDGLLSMGLEKTERGTDEKTSRSSKTAVGGVGFECFLTSNKWVDVGDLKTVN